MLGMAVSAYTLLAFAPAPTSDIVLTSENFPGEIRLDLNQPTMTPDSAAEPGWGRYLRGAACSLGDRLPSAPRGFTGRVSGSLPAGGLSSSASVILAYLLVLAESNGLALEPRELIELALRAEKNFVGVKVGILDPAAIVGGDRGHLLAINTRETKWEAVPLGLQAPDYRILVVFSGITRNLAGTDYNERVEQCHEAARKLAALSGKREVRGLGDLPDSVFDEHSAKLSLPEARRARHFFSERFRVQRGRLLWEKGDLEGFGRLMKQSCESSINHWESGSPELIGIQRILLETEGVFGSRFSGAGWGGCCLALVAGGEAEEILISVQQKMAARFPELEGRSRVFLLESEGGLRIV